jgi:hypothetical protein
LNLGELLPPRAAERLADLVHHDRHPAQAVVGEAHGGRNRVDDRGEHRRRILDAERQHEYTEVDEHRHDLCGIEDRAQQPLHPFGAGGPDADRDADRQRQHDRDDHQRQRDHRQVPVADNTDAEHGERAPDRGPVAARRKSDRGRECEHARPAQAAQDPQHEPHESVDGVGDRAEDPREQPVVLPVGGDPAVHPAHFLLDVAVEPRGHIRPQERADEDDGRQ